MMFLASPNSALVHRIHGRAGFAIKAFREVRRINHRSNNPVIRSGINDSYGLLTRSRLCDASASASLTLLYSILTGIEEVNGHPFVFAVSVTAGVFLRTKSGNAKREKRGWRKKRRRVEG